MSTGCCSMVDNSSQSWIPANTTTEAGDLSTRQLVNMTVTELVVVSMPPLSGHSMPMETEEAEAFRVPRQLTSCILLGLTLFFLGGVWWLEACQAYLNRVAQDSSQGARRRGKPTAKDNEAGEMMEDEALETVGVEAATATAAAEEDEEEKELSGLRDSVLGPEDESPEVAAWGGRLGRRMMLGKAVGLLTAALVGLGFEVIEVRLGKPGSTAYFTFYAGLVLLAGLHTELGLGVQLPTGFRGLVEATIFAGRAMHSLQTSEITSSQLAGVARSLDAYLAAACAGLLIYRDAIRAAPGLEYRCLLIGQMTSGLVLLQAVWIWQTAAMIDPWHSRPWIQSGHKSVIFATLIFSVQMLLVLVGQNGLLVGLRTRRRRRPNMSDRPAATRAHRLMVEGNPRTLVYTSLQRRLPA